MTDRWDDDIDALVTQRDDLVRENQQLRGLLYELWPDLADPTRWELADLHTHHMHPDLELLFEIVAARNIT